MIRYQNGAKEIFNKSKESEEIWANQENLSRFNFPTIAGFIHFVIGSIGMALIADTENADFTLCFISMLIGSILLIYGSYHYVMRKEEYKQKLSAK